MGLWVLLLQLTAQLSFGAYQAPVSVCDNKNINYLEETKQKINESEFIFTVRSEDVSCLESQSKLRSRAFDRFHDKISDRTNTEPRYLLARQKQAHFELIHFVSLLFDMVLNEEIGKLRDINLLESFLMNQHLKLNGSQTEFLAFILRAPTGELKVYFVSGQNPDTVGASKKLSGLVNNDVLNNKYVLSGHLHNHPFNLDRKQRDIGGVTMPSQTDRDVYKMLNESFGLEHSYVTNGFSTLEIPASQFSLFPKDY